MDPRIKAKILRIVDISYGMDRGLQEALTLSEDILADAALTKERKVLQTFFTEVSTTDGNYATGIKEVFLALEQGAVDQLLCWEELPTTRYTLRNGAKDDEQVVHYTPLRKDKEPSIAELLKGRGVDPSGYELAESLPLTEWLCENFARYGAKLVFVSNNSDLGAQFAGGFGGIGAVLRYHMDFDVFEEPDTKSEEDDSVGDDDDFMFDDFAEGGDSDEADDWTEPTNVKSKDKGKGKEKEKEKEEEKEEAPPKAPKAEKPPSPEKEKPKKEGGGATLKLEFVAAATPAPPRVISAFNVDAPTFVPKSKRLPSPPPEASTPSSSVSSN